jgi:hypothetical protein
MYHQGFSALHIAAVTSTTWILLLNAVVGYQLLEDGTAISVCLVFASSGFIFIGTGYIALDTGFSFTKEWLSTLNDPNQAYALYTLYLLAPLIFVALFFILETYLVLRVLAETKPLSMSLFKLHLQS